MVIISSGELYIHIVIKKTNTIIVKKKKTTTMFSYNSDLEALIFSIFYRSSEDKSITKKGKGDEDKVGNSRPRNHFDS